jgi:hypothetical protein
VILLGLVSRKNGFAAYKTLLQNHDNAGSGETEQSIFSKIGAVEP